MQAMGVGERDTLPRMRTPWVRQLMQVMQAMGVGEWDTLPRMHIARCTHTPCWVPVKGPSSVVMQECRTHSGTGRNKCSVELGHYRCGFGGTRVAVSLK